MLWASSVEVPCAKLVIWAAASRQSFHFVELDCMYASGACLLAYDTRNRIVQCTQRFLDCDHAALAHTEAALGTPRHGFEVYSFI